MTTIGEVNAISNVLQNEHEIEWKISNFSSLSTDKCYESPPFSFAGESWYLSLHLNDDVTEGSTGYIGLYLWKSTSDPSIELNYTLGLKSFTGEKDSEHHRTYNFNSAFMGYGVHGCIMIYELLERKSALMPSDVLTLFCNLKHPKHIKESSGTVAAKCLHCSEFFDAKIISSHQKKCLDKPIKCPDCSSVVALKNWYDHDCLTARAEDIDCTSGSSVFHDFKDFYLKKELCDVIFKVEGQEFPAHRAILSARSPVFASTFRHDTKEKTTGIIDIEDCEPFSFSDFLCFLYCGDRNIISLENVFKLFTAGDKYNVQDLRAECVRFMKENLSVDIFCDTITIALQHSETELFTVATHFFTKNALEIVKTVKWQSFLANNPTQGNELFIKVLTDKNSNE